MSYVYVDPRVGDVAKCRFDILKTKTENLQIKLRTFATASGENSTLSRSITVGLHC